MLNSNLMIIENRACRLASKLVKCSKFSDEYILDMIDNFVFCECLLSDRCEYYAMLNSKLDVILNEAKKS